MNKQTQFIFIPQRKQKFIKFFIGQVFFAGFAFALDLIAKRILKQLLPKAVP